MDNHVYLITVPAARESIRAVAEAHRRYTCYVNTLEGWCGYLWQGRFASVVMDEAHCYEAILYVENNPVRAGVIQSAQEYRFSSARYHVYDKKDKNVARCYWQDLERLFAGGRAGR